MNPLSWLGTRRQALDSEQQARLAALLLLLVGLARPGVAEALGNQLGIRATIEIAEPSSLPRYELKARRFRFKREKR